MFGSAQHAKGKAGPVQREGGAGSGRNGIWKAREAGRGGKGRWRKWERSRKKVWKSKCCGGGKLEKREIEEMEEKEKRR